MPIVASKTEGGSFTPHPEGQFPAVCCDLHDLGMMKVTWQGQEKQQRKCDVYFFCGEYREHDGKRIPLLVRERFTVSLSDNARLRKFLEAWRGRKFTPEEEKGFDLETLLLAPAFLQVTHNESNGNTYANISTIMRLPKGMPAPDLPADFVRPSQRPPREDRQGNGKPAQSRSGGPGMDRDVPPPAEPSWQDSDDSDLPF